MRGQVTGIFPVMCTSADVNETDTLVTSTTVGHAQVDNTETDPKKIIGYAFTAKSTGSAGTVLARIGGR